MLLMTESKIISAIETLSEGEFKDYFNTEEGEAELSDFLKENLADLVEKGDACRFVNILIVGSILQNNCVLSGDVLRSVAFSKDPMQWAEFENSYFEYYVQCSELLV